jgi:hypothetical protein
MARSEDSWKITVGKILEIAVGICKWLLYKIF